MSVKRPKISEHSQQFGIFKPGSENKEQGIDILELGNKLQQLYTKVQTIHKLVPNEHNTEAVNVLQSLSEIITNAPAEAEADNVNEANVDNQEQKTNKNRISDAMSTPQRYK